MVVAQIGAIDYEVDEVGCRTEGLSQEVAHGKGDGIAQQTFVGMVGKEGPTLVLGISLAEEFGGLVELDAVGLLGQVPGGVATAANLKRVVLHHLIGIHIGHRGIDVVTLAGDLLSPEGLDVDGGDIGQLFVLRHAEADHQAGYQTEENTFLHTISFLLYSTKLQVYSQ